MAVTRFFDEFRDNSDPKRTDTDTDNNNTDIDNNNNNNNNNLYQQLESFPTFAFRGDTRDPKEIFEFGFSRRGGGWEYYQQNKKIQELTLNNNDYYDVDPHSAVCLTKSFDIAPLFPILDKDGGEPPVDTWIYIVLPRNVYPTYKKQREEKSFLAFALEIATRDIPSGDVICAIKCKRYINVDDKGVRTWAAGMHYQLSGDIIWNPKLANEPQTPLKLKRKEMIKNVINKKRGKYIQCPIPLSDTDDKEVENNMFMTVGMQITEEQHHLLEFVNYTKRCQSRNERMNRAFELLHHCSMTCKIPGLNVTLPEYVFYSGLDEIAQFLLYRNIKPRVISSSHCSEELNYLSHLPKETFAKFYVFKHELKASLENNTIDSAHRPQVYSLLRSLNEFYRTTPPPHLNAALKSCRDCFAKIPKNTEDAQSKYKP